MTYQLGKKVLLGSEVYYSKKGFTIDPKNEKDYFQKLDLYVKMSSNVLSSRNMNLAKFYHFLLHDNLLPYPFDKPSSIQKLNSKDFFLNGFKKYEKTFQNFIMTSDEWKLYTKKTIQRKFR